MKKVANYLFVSGKMCNFAAVLIIIINMMKNLNGLLNNIIIIRLQSVAGSDEVRGI